MNDIDAVLGELAAGRLTTGQAAARVGAMTFPVSAPGDFDTPAGSFFPVSLAFLRGELDQATYAELAEAAAGQIRQQKAS